MFVIHFTYKCDTFCFYQFALTEKKGLGSRGWRTTRVVKQFLREQIRKLDVLVRRARCPTES